MGKSRTYIAIDLKSFYASVECIERNLDPMTANLVVADSSRTEKTICLAVSPSLKSFGIPGRPRLFEVIQKIKKVNEERIKLTKNGVFEKSSYDINEINSNPNTEVSYIIAPPRMAYYIEYSTKIYNIYLKYIAPEDIHVYSIDEVFIDATNYLKTYNLTAKELAMKIISDVLNTTKITATAGIGTNLYLCKTAMDIVAKHIKPDENGVRIASLTEYEYRQKLWNHTPLTDFWRIGKGYAKKLNENGLYTMGDIARCSLGKSSDFYNENLLFKLFGVNAELLIDHAWGWEPCTIKDIKSYKPSENSVGAGQVLHCPYTFEKARLVIREMADSLALTLVDHGLVTNQLTITVGYDIENIKNNYTGELDTDNYGRKIPKHSHSTINLDSYTSSGSIIVDSALKLFDEITNQNLFIRRLNITANKIISESDIPLSNSFKQLDLFSDIKTEEKTDIQISKEKNMQKAILSIKKKYGKNAILKGVSLTEGATAKERNNQIGGHRA